jgi:plastocyanin domain-containing protein
MNPIFLAAALLAAASAPRTIAITVTKQGFEPDRIEVKKGEPVRLAVTRKTEETCATELVIKEAKIEKELPLNKTVEIEFTPKKSGELTYTCGMNMVSGVLVVQ